MYRSARDQQVQQVLQYVAYTHAFRETASSLRCKLGGDVITVREALERCVREGTLQKRPLASDTLYFRTG